ncbi:MAG: hypothetical protein V3V95_05710 [Thermodesulfobacteriota bacterium]
MKRSSIIWLLILVAIAYGGYKLIPMYYRHQMMTYEVDGQVKVAHRYDEDEIKDTLLEKVKEWGMPIKPDNILVDRRETNIIITVNYHVDIEFLNRFTRRFYFKIQKRGNIRDKIYN